MNRIRRIAIFRILFSTALLCFGLPMMNGCGDEDTDFATGTYVGVQVFGIGQISSPMTLQLQHNDKTVNGSVTPPFKDTLEAISNSTLNGDTIQFDRKESSITYRYSGTFNRNGVNTVITGGFAPLGCLDPSSGEPCQTDSNGSFTVSKQ
jgi:hypothetical protein